MACVGDLMLDRYVYGEVSRISPEAPIPVLARRRETAMLGAAGNVARNAAALFVPCHRVLGSDGGLGGFRWGTAVKRRLLDHEARHAPVAV